MKQKTSLCFFVIFVAFLLVGCSSRPLPVVSEVNEANIKFVFAESPLLDVDSDMMARQLLSDDVSYSQILDSALARRTVYNILLDSIIALQADDFDLRSNPGLFLQHRIINQDMLLRAFYTNYILDSISVPDSEIEAYYNENIGEFSVGDQYRARHIVISGFGLKKRNPELYANMSDSALDELAYDKLDSLRLRLLNGEAFDTLAMLYSQDENTADKGGDIGYFELNQMVTPVDSVIEHTPIGEISGIVKTMFGYHVLKVEDMIPGHTMELDSVRQQIEYSLLQRKVATRSYELIDSLREAGTMVLDTAQLMIADSLHQQIDPLAYINTEDTVYGNDTLYFYDYGREVYKYQKMKGDMSPLKFDEKVLIIKSILPRFYILRVARQMGYDKDSALVAQSENTRLKYAVSILKKDLLDEDYEPTDDEIKAYYDSHLEDYLVDRPLKVQHIVFEDSAMAEYVRDLIYSGIDFMDMAQEYYPGEEDIRRTAADLGYIGPEDMPHNFYKAAERTQIGEVSHPVKTEYGYHLIKVLDKHHNVGLESAAGKIRTILQKKHKEDMIEAYVEENLGKPPKIYYKMIEDLYRIKMPDPTEALQR